MRVLNVKMKYLSFRNAFIMVCLRNELDINDGKHQHIQ